ncbi:hypothetical protein [Desulfurococcus sp.]|uniref:hypothetical protein n=1 Tax=Desulfurococcus sp. TaxID=51678 RepID=UPI00319D9819
MEKYIHGSSRNLFTLSYADGAYALYSIEAIINCVERKIGNKMFIDEFLPR